MLPAMLRGMLLPGVLVRLMHRHLYLYCTTTVFMHAWIYRTAPFSDVEAVRQGVEMHETAASSGGPLVIADNENISHSNGSEDGWWRQCLVVRNGKRVPANWRQQQQ